MFVPHGRPPKTVDRQQLADRARAMLSPEPAGSLSWIKDAAAPAGSADRPIGA